MRKTTDLVVLAQEIQRQSESKRDYVAPAPLITLHPWDKERAQGTLDGMRLEVSGQGHYGLKQYAHNQLAEYCGIPKRYYDDMRRELPTLAAFNVNEWLRSQDHKAEKRLIRTLDGEVRGFLSDTYRPLENIDLAAMALPALLDNKMQIWESSITDTRLYIKASSPKLEGEVKKGDVVHGGVCIRNSEVGNGALALEFFIGRLVCLNGMIGETVVRRNHVGKRMLTEEAVAAEYIKDDTRKAQDAALFLQFRDTLDALLAGDRFEKFLTIARGATVQMVEKPLETIEVLSERFAFNEAEKQAVLKNLIDGGDLSRWGFANAVTAAARVSDDYERETELQRLGYEVITLPKTEWEAIAIAA